MNAVVRIKGKQYLVKPGDVLTVNLLNKKAKSSVVFGEVLLTFDDQGKIVLGNPLVKGVKVETEIIEDIKGKKVISQKFKAKKRSRVRRGFRAQLTKIKIKKIGNQQ
ncbi:MAG: 50S ribosomal protein L21 [uncultured bacterium]|nr:MAG: 50S ribosomal protein L21 [uncultured bacterium]